MHHRQRAILFLISGSGGSLSREKLTRLIYLLREAMPSRGGASFYDFIPLPSGPRSFALEFEIGDLLSQDLIEEPEPNRLVITKTGYAEGPATPTWLQQDLRGLLLGLGTESEQTLAAHVAMIQQNAEAERGPCTTASSDTLDPSRKRLYTVGYEALSVDHLLDGLRRIGLSQLIDVRSTPYSRRFGFHGRTLERLCAELSIAYRHFPNLGLESTDTRPPESQADYDRLFEHYCQTTLPEETIDIGHVADLAKANPSVLLGFERNATRCHRSHLARKVHEASGLAIVDLDLLGANESETPA